MITGKDTTQRGRRVKRDGAILRSKAEIAKDYDSSVLPYPLKNLWKLDYCWKLNYQMWKHSIYVALPTTGIYFIYSRMPECWEYTRKTMPYKAFAINFVCVTLIINAYNTVWSLAFEDYCKRGSTIYDTKKRNA